MNGDTLLSVIADELPMFVAYVGADQRYLYLNRMYEQRFGRPRDEMIGRAVRDVLGPDLYEQIRPHVEAALAGRRVEHETLVRPEGGEPRWFSALLSPHIDDRSRVAGFVVCVRDVTEQREQVRRYGSLLDAVLESSQDAIFLQDLDGRYELINSAGARIIGRTPDQVIGRTDCDLFPGDAATRIRRAVKQVQESGQGLVHEEPLPVGEDSRTFQARMDLYRDHDGNVAGIIGIARDTTDRKRAEEALRESEERFRKIFEHSNDAVFLIDPDGERILDCNAKACSMLAYDREELLALPVGAIHPHDMTLLRSFVRSVISEGRGWTDELSCRARTGRNVPAEVSASVMEVDGRRCLLALVRDITERKQAQEQLERYSRNLEQLVEERTAQLRQSGERQRALLEINNALISKLTREALFASIAQSVARVVPFDLTALLLYDAGGDLLRVVASAGSLSPKRFGSVGTEVPRLGSHVGWVFDHRQPLLRSDLETGHQYPAEESLLEGGLRSYVVVPLLAQGRAIGTLNVASRSPDRFTDETAEFLVEVGTQVALAVENMLVYEEIAGLKARLEEENLYLQSEIRTQHRFDEVVGRSGAITRVLRVVETVAPTNATVLILGETGTGKELVARAIHNLEAAAARPLVKVNCAALPAGLIESELFGHEKGAFTGAVARRQGRFELADGGTIFLDEIGDLPLELQAKLLRVLQDGEFERVGGSQTLKVRVRVIAATNRDLERALREGRFREDLYYRLSVFPIHIPPLRERKEDIPILIRHFVLKHGVRLGKRIEMIPQRKLDLLTLYPWPGNVRELENVVERAMILSAGPQLRLDDWLPTRAAAPPQLRISTLEELEREHIVRVLDLTGGRISGEAGAAAILGMKRTTLQGRMLKLGIRRSDR